MRTGRRAAVLALGLLQATTGCAAGTPVPPAAAAAGRPAQAECAAVRDVDFRALERERARLPVAIGGPVVDMLDVVRIPDWAARRPPEDAAVVIRARMPPGGGHSSDHRSVVWREADGTWWFWRHSVNEGPPAPPPPPPPGLTREEIDVWYAARNDSRTADERYWPPHEGRLSAQKTAQMEAAWRDPCRAWDPDWWPHDLPLNRRIDGSRRRLCPQDSSAIIADMAEAGRPRRSVGGACINATPTYRMIEIAAYAAADAAPR
ncbi:MAG: hypothetical protein PSV23_11210 [Brevundimonas sp.]|uniref:hypothetical protein n=1 Tax=Brevundimonas sp. TaxID=1871086 RepID=UPI0024893E17|nr:hypothetical protein [Brevundimonas sp.]MDI1327354.1 hypothetical protein [Brevundimonas sp.]